MFWLAAPASIGIASYRVLGGLRGVASATFAVRFGYNTSGWSWLIRSVYAVRVQARNTSAIIAACFARVLCNRAGEPGSR